VAPARVVDLTGDQPAVLGLPDEPAPGVRDWLRTGAHAPADALDHLAIDINVGVSLLPAGAPDIGAALPEAGARPALPLPADPRPTVCAAGGFDAPALLALAEVADASVMVVRGCYLALRRAVHHEATEACAGVVLIDEHGRSLVKRDVEDVLGLPVLAAIEARGAIARAVDAGLLPTRLPDALARPMRHALTRLGVIEGERAA